MLVSKREKDMLAESLMRYMEARIERVEAVNQQHIDALHVRLTEIIKGLNAILAEINAKSGRAYLGESLPRVRRGAIDDRRRKVKNVTPGKGG